MVSHFEYMTNGSERQTDRQTDTATDRPLFYHFPLDAASIIKAMHYADLNFSQGTENCKKNYFLSTPTIEQFDYYNYLPLSST